MSATPLAIAPETLILGANTGDPIPVHRLAFGTMRLVGEGAWASLPSADPPPSPSSGEQ